MAESTIAPSSRIIQTVAAGVSCPKLRAVTKAERARETTGARRGRS